MCTLCPCSGGTLVEVITSALDVMLNNTQPCVSSDRPADPFTCVKGQEGERKKRKMTQLALLSYSSVLMPLQLCFCGNEEGINVCHRKFRNVKRIHGH